MLAILLQWPGSREEFVQRVSAMLSGAGPWLFDALLMVSLVLLGAALGGLSGALLGAILRRSGFDEGVRRLVGARSFAKRPPSAVAIWAWTWSWFVAGLLLALEGVGVRLGTAVVQRLADVVPRILTAAALMGAGALMAFLCGTLMQRFLEPDHPRLCRFAGQCVTAVLLGISALLALEQMGFAAQFIIAVGIVGVGALGLAFALAFGLGCRDLAKEFVVEYMRQMEPAQTEHGKSEP